MRGKHNGKTLLIQSKTSQIIPKDVVQVLHKCCEMLVFSLRSLPALCENRSWWRQWHRKAKEKCEYLCRPRVCAFFVALLFSPSQRWTSAFTAITRHCCFADWQEVPMWNGCNLLLQLALGKYMKHIGPCCFHKLKGVCDSKSTPLTARHALGQPQQ